MLGLSIQATLQVRTTIAYLQNDSQDPPQSGQGKNAHEPVVSNHLYSIFPMSRCDSIS